MKASELRDLTAEELQGKFDDLREELFNLRFQNATGQLENPMRLGQVKKDIARTLTLLREKEVAE